MSNLFSNSKYTFLNLSNFDTSKVIDMSSMFSSCSSLKDLSLDNFDTKAFFSLSINFDTRNVLDISNMFQNCESLGFIDININTDKVVNISGMFKFTNLKSIDLSSFKKEMFYSNQILSSLNLSHFKTSKVITMESMFEKNMRLIILDISNLDTCQVMNMENMFFGLMHVKNMKNMFLQCQDLTSLDVSNFKTERVVDIGGNVSIL